MSAVEELSIVLQHDIDEQYQYQPGEIIRGKIIIKLSRPTALRSINVKAYGEGNASWKDDSDDGEMYQAKEVYVDAVKAVLDTTNTEPLSLDYGVHEFLFDYLLPEAIPSSYIGKYGNVTYTMKVTVSGVKSGDTSISSEPFLVLRRSPLPSKSLQPLSLQTTKRMWASCTFGKLYINVSLDKQGGVPGEDIFLKAEIKNHSRRTVTAMQASLIMDSLFKAQNHETQFRQIVSKKRDEFDIGYMEGRRWTYVRLPLPPYIPETKLECCEFIDLDYSFQFRVELSGGDEIKMEAPFWVGAQPHGFEVPKDEKTGLNINRQWTVRGTKGIDLLDHQDSEKPMDYNDGWGVEIVPELRPDSAVITNPLFQQNIAQDLKIIPEESMENTRL
ncbi:arrestin domain-containing protein 2 [Biomphalaria glabrata]|uniref:Arrestin domain-containing protein 2-like n=1 Tax=Biomphalaria glabrata TaxID=6526 RepID=A0A2C9LCJ1_BIOGL|nr:arrestin domain-containing protein 2-like [Biomphalaria glabrata]XP_013061688.1 arrestin domain-containing protein 2-like [Biomphalaria glabrata]XP_013061690.1 arrestin domain-containing protein 2-like [Biomphalaria glabrata]XP_013061691.1 arrestin domain-containing protein 2-like [Biomphalaria glabrata]XP_055896280.1 arrestin domain-containing protein 2-like [Biomphalaria glabrata]KAI8732240.1 arrestin domain-containing protein 2-like [Biomphalaria glabrata]KAI8778690.1 arrestin domain-co